MKNNFSKGTIFFGGSRHLLSASVVSAFVRSALAAGFSLRSGCATGADALTINAVLAAGAASRLSVFCAFVGFSPSTPARFLAAARAGAKVYFSSFSGPVSAVLAARSRSAVVGSRFCVWFLSPAGAARGSSSGSLLAAAFAASKGIPVFVASCGFAHAPALLAGLSGSWVRVQLWGFPVWRWLPFQMRF